MLERFFDQGVLDRVAGVLEQPAGPGADQFLDLDGGGGVGVPGADEGQLERVR